jgi:SAM-dependent methyltransferase
VEFGDLGRLTPISRVFSLDRGLGVERYYIEQFLACNASDIQGHVLEFGDDQYTRKFGADRVTKSDVLHVAAGEPKATIVADLTCDDSIPSDTFDCIICTQTLQMIYEVRSAVRSLHRMLKPGGVVLVTSHGMSKIGRREGVDPWGEYWHFTAQSLRRLFLEVFLPQNVNIRVYGNVLAAIAFLHGLAATELRREALDHSDPDYEVIIAVRAAKPPSAIHA